jgi:hypothetical protein
MEFYTGTKKNEILSFAGKWMEWENIILRDEDKVEELDLTVKDHERMLRKYEWNMKDIWNTMKRPNL